MRTLTVIVVSVLSVTSLALTSVPAGAQAVLSVGGHFGAVRARQLQDRGEDSGTRTGLLAGAYVDAPTPLPWLSVLAEVSYAERGGHFTFSDEADAEVRAAYLVFVVAPTARVDLGPVALAAYAGPGVETSVSTRFSPNLAGAYDTPTAQVFIALVGAGLEVRPTRKWVLRMEIRHVEGVSAAFTDETGDFRHRSTEILLRVGRRGLP
jgi:opacity protein-like surface antigen